MSLLALLFLHGAFAGAGETVKFSGYEWQVRKDALSGPGPNLWDPQNVWVDEKGRLHLRITHHGGKWQCAEVYLSRNLGFGRYQWEIDGRLEKLDPNIVLGLFNYTLPEIGPDGTNEIDIEYARWGKAEILPGNFTVWPAVKTVKQATKPFDFHLDGTSTTSRFDWSSKGVSFQMLEGARNDQVIQSWEYMPADSREHIPQHPLPLHMNLWLFEGKPPKDNREVEIIIKSFTFTPQE